jgi:hypothetical protein
LPCRGSAPWLKFFVLFAFFVVKAPLTTLSCSRNFPGHSRRTSALHAVHLRRWPQSLSDFGLRISDFRFHTAGPRTALPREQREFNQRSRVSIYDPAVDESEAAA